MNEPVLLAFLIRKGEVEVAVAGLGGAPVSARFANDSGGMQRLADWMLDNAQLTEETVANSWVALAPGVDDSAYTSAAMQFAYETTSSTAVWSAATLERFGLVGSALCAAAMLPHCMQEQASGHAG